MNLDDLEGHPDAMLWLSRSKAAIAAYEEARKRRERTRAFLAVLLSLFGTAAILSTLW